MSGAPTYTREEFIARRKSGIGGSDIAVILGLSPWRTQLQLKLDKTTDREEEETPAMRRGNVLEPIVADEYAQDKGRKVVRYNAQLQDGIFLGNVDRLVVDEGEKVAAHMGNIRTTTGLEIKTARDNRAWTDGVPEYYQAQVQWYMGLCPTILRFDVAVKFMDTWNNFYCTVERDDELIRVMREQAQEWWDRYIIHDETPTAENEADCRLLWARSNPGKVAKASEAVADTVAAFIRADLEAKEAKKKADMLKAEVITFMEDAETLVDMTGKPLCTYKSAKGSTKTDWEAVAHVVCPDGIPQDILASYTTESEGTRRFLVKNK